MGRIVSVLPVTETPIRPLDAETRHESRSPSGSEKYSLKSSETDEPPAVSDWAGMVLRMTGFLFTRTLKDCETLAFPSLARTVTVARPALSGESASVTPLRLAATTPDGEEDDEYCKRSPSLSVNQDDTFRRMDDNPSVSVCDEAVTLISGALFG